VQPFLERREKGRAIIEKEGGSCPFHTSTIFLRGKKTTKRGEIA